MSLTIINNHKAFNKNENLSIIFKNCFSEDDFNFKKEKDFTFIFSNNKLVGINVFNYKKYFKVESGFHLINNETKNFLLKKFPNYVNPTMFDSFFKIGLVQKNEKHPESEKLRVLKVMFSDRERQIITNVQNIKENNKYLFALEGSITSSGLKIVKSKIKNVLSEGMIMSYKSLGQNNDAIIDCNKYNLSDEFNF